MSKVIRLATADEARKGSQNIMVGPRGGRYYVSSSGEHVYVDKDGNPVKGGGKETEKPGSKAAAPKPAGKINADELAMDLEDQLLELRWMTKRKVPEKQISDARQRLHELSSKLTAAGYNLSGEKAEGGHLETAHELWKPVSMHFSTAAGKALLKEALSTTGRPFDLHMRQRLIGNKAWLENSREGVEYKLEDALERMKGWDTHPNKDYLAPERTRTLRTIGDCVRYIRWLDTELIKAGFYKAE